MLLPLCKTFVAAHALSLYALRMVWFAYFVYLSSLPVAHLSDTPRRRLVVKGDSARIQDETTENSAWFFNVLGVSHRHTGPWFNVSSERLLINFWLASQGLEPTTCRDPKHCVHEFYALPTELIGRLNHGAV